MADGVLWAIDTFHRLFQVAVFIALINRVAEPPGEKHEQITEKAISFVNGAFHLS